MNYDVQREVGTYRPMFLLLISADASMYFLPASGTERVVSLLRINKIRLQILLERWGAFCLTLASLNKPLFVLISAQFQCYPFDEFIG